MTPPERCRCPRRGAVLEGSPPSAVSMYDASSSAAHALSGSVIPPLSCALASRCCSPKYPQKPDLKLFRTLMAYKVRLLEHTPASSHAIAGDEERGKIMFDMRTFALHCYSTLSACRPRRDLPHIHRSLGLSRRQSQLIIKIVRWTSSSTPQTRPHHAVRLKTDDELRDLGREHVETV
ncbi:hypothetical protein DFH09DRAFT_1309452 [Mycena vulgaris]|nr:hypothetical protein DFH09DRAFT_1309452 [Mycena vulgaris]